MRCCLIPVALLFAVPAHAADTTLLPPTVREMLEAAIANGNETDIATVAKLLGTSVNHIAKTYGHIMDDHLAVAAQRMTRPR